MFPSSLFTMSKESAEPSGSRTKTRTAGERQQSMRIKVISKTETTLNVLEGKRIIPTETRVIDADTGREIDGVTNVSWSIGHNGQPVKLMLELVDFDMELSQAERAPQPNRFSL